MAFLKSSENKIKSKESVLKVLEYITNPEKAFLVSTENCNGDANNISIQFNDVRALQKKIRKNEILTHHYIQSFSPEDNVTPEQAHQIAIELMEKVAPNYQYVISTHVDKEHIHNHILLNSVNPVTCYKWHDNKNTINHMRSISDELCLKYNLSVIDKSEAKGIDQTTYQLGIKGTSWKINLVKDLDEAIIQCKSKIEFIDFLNKRGYSVKYSDTHITITKNGEKKGIRVDTLARQFGEKYKKVNLEKAMGYHSAKKNNNKIENKKIETVTDSVEKNTNLSIKENNKKENTEIITEWQRYESWYFKEDKEKPKKFKNISSLPKRITTMSKLRNFILKLIFYILLKSYKKINALPIEKKKKFIKLKNWTFKEKIIYL